MPTRKWCSGCAQFLVLAEFWLVHRGQEARQDWCKSCRRAWRYSYREIEREQDRARYRRLREKVAASPGDTGR